MVSIQQKRIQITGTVKEIVPANPQRIGLMIQNNYGSVEVRMYVRRAAIRGGIYVYDKQWLKIDAKDGADLQWWAKTDGTNIYIHIIEFFQAPAPKKGWW